MQLSDDQIASLSPDPASLKAGQGLSSPSKWIKVEYSPRALWGECQGSGKLPYQTQVDLENIAFKCTCPSRKFPCKHGLGLLILFSKNKTHAKNNEEPSWVADWLDKRKEKVEKKQSETPKPVDAEAQAKRADARHKKVVQGIDEVQVWIKDLIRAGLLDLPNHAYDYWQMPSKRLVDAQATGLATLVSELGNYNYFDDSWKYNVLNQLVKIFTLGEAYKNVDYLPENLKEEVRSLVGFTQSKEDVLAQEGISDTWMVLSKTAQLMDKVTVERNWLWGKQSKRFALFLQYYVGGQLPEQNLVQNTSLKGEIVFYKGVNNYRALLKKIDSIGNINDLEFLPDFDAAYEVFNSVFSQNPFVEGVPAMIENIQFIKHGTVFYAKDIHGKTVKINTTLESELHILAITGGKPAHVFMSLNETSAMPLSIFNPRKAVVS